MKTVLGFVALVLYTFCMLAWGSMGSAQVCSRIAPATHHHVLLPCPDPAPEQGTLAPTAK